MKLLVTSAINLDSTQKSMIHSLGFDLIEIESEQTNTDINCSTIDVVICNGFFLNNDISKFTNLKMIQTTSTGLDRIPLEYVNENNIKVCNAKGVYSIPIAEWVLLKTLEIFKDSAFFYENQNSKKWVKNYDLQELNGKTASIVGYGDIGKEISKRLASFGVNIINVGRKNRSDEFSRKHINISQINRALEISDIVIVTLPLTEKTKHLFNKTLFSDFKQDSVFINVSRGNVVNTNDLIDALTNGKVSYAALDVFEEEPLSPASKLWDMDVIITPHNSFYSESNNSRLFKLIIENLKRFREMEQK